MADNDVQIIAKELAASGDPITAVEVKGKKTLRQALATVYWKAASVIKLNGDRPRDPKLGDDQFGHVMSARAEGLVNQAYLLAIIERINNPKAGLIDANALKEKTLGDFNG